MLEDIPIPTGLNPIVRATPADRLASFNAKSNSIYNRFSPYTNYGSIGPSQPFVYTKISESSFNKNLTKYDSLAFPVGSTVRDLKRVGQYLVTGNGILYIGKQLLLQQQNSFNETRVYNPLSVLKATAKPASLGLIDYPQRHLETSGGLLNFFIDAFKSTLGMATDSSQKPSIDGTASGKDGNGAASDYAKAHGGARAGVMRLGTAKSASSTFESIWVTNPSQGGTNGGFLANLGNALLSKLKSLIPSTNPMGAFGGTSSEVWEYRPEYKKNKNGVYYAFISDNAGFMAVNAPASQLFYNDRVFANANAAGKSTVKIVSDYHKYYPQKQTDKSTAVWYADPTKISSDSVGVSDVDGNNNNLKSLHERMVKSIDSFKPGTSNQFRRSAERYSEVKDEMGNSYPTYKNKQDTANSFEQNFETKIGGKVTTLDDRGFAKVSVYKNKDQYFNQDGADKYNLLEVRPGKRDKEPEELVESGTNQSKDLIFFYFYDLINEVYIPFRAVIDGISDQNTADWEEQSYIGRADKLFLYKGFSRDVALNFTVYASSAKEMLPMWNRISYLVGLTRPSKYTGDVVVTQGQKDINAARRNTVEELNATEDYERQEALNEVLKNLDSAEKDVTATGREGKFIYPPMTTFRLGDLFVDQPCFITSISVTPSDESNWETLRADEDAGYKYVSSPTNTILIPGIKSRQLPLQAKITVNMKIAQKAQALGSNCQYGKTTYDVNGKETGKWLL